ncbi:MAG: hypothetical protein IJT41_03030, partial [Clostridia bacterium]|nr:hypothetical protein [Clostridia bacterium]
VGIAQTRAGMTARKNEKHRRHNLKQTNKNNPLSLRAKRSNPSPRKTCRQEQGERIASLLERLAIETKKNSSSRNFVG